MWHLTGYIRPSILTHTVPQSRIPAVHLRLRPDHPSFLHHSISHTEKPTVGILRLEIRTLYNFLGAWVGPCEAVERRSISPNLDSPLTTLGQQLQILGLLSFTPNRLSFSLHLNPCQLIIISDTTTDSRSEAHPIPNSPSHFPLTLASLLLTIHSGNFRIAEDESESYRPVCKKISPFL